MYSNDVKDLGHFLHELQSETDRGLPLVCAAFLDIKLADSLLSFFANSAATKRLLYDSNAPLGTFSAKIDSCLALGLIDNFEYHELNLVRKIRNRFAHEKHGVSFKDKDIISWCLQFKTELPSGDSYSKASARFKFINTVTSLVMRLYYRAAYVEKEKRTIKKRVADDVGRWRDIKGEKPPEGIPVLALGKTKK